MTSRPHDTTPAAWAVQTAALDEMGGPERVRVAIELSEAVREIRLSGIAARHPELDRREVVALLVLEEYGIDLPDAR
jgi:hypothetical protein